MSGETDPFIPRVGNTIIIASIGVSFWNWMIGVPIIVGTFVVLYIEDRIDAKKRKLRNSK